MSIASALSTLQSLRLSLRKPKGRVIVFCGAGLSAPSGLAVYRGSQGAWTLSPEAHAAMDMRNWPGSRQAALSHLAQWRVEALGKQPNAAHKAIASWKRAWPGHVDIVTQNVDGLLQKAGLSDSDVLEVHGSLHRMRCMACRAEWPMGDSGDNGQPCSSCHSGDTKPSVVFFHEGAPLYPRMRDICAPERRMPADTFVAIGTSWRVIPPEMLMDTRGRVLGLQLGVDEREQPELDPWLHEQFAGGAIEGVAWAQGKFTKQWRLG